MGINRIGLISDDCYDKTKHEYFFVQLIDNKVKKKNCSQNKYYSDIP